MVNIISGGTTTIDYNYDNKPTSVTFNGVTTSFVYDGSGARVKKTNSYGTTIYIGNLYECRDGICTKYIFANGKRIAANSNGDIIYYHQDHLGSTRLVTNDLGANQESIYYSPFGATQSDTGAVSVDHKYTSQEFDAETGLYYYGARYYNPELGRFVTPDTIVPDYSNPQSLNRYAYVLNNPMKYLDPTGHMNEVWWGKVDADKEYFNSIKYAQSSADYSQSTTTGYDLSGGGYKALSNYNFDNYSFDNQSQGGMQSTESSMLSSSAWSSVNWGDIGYHAATATVGFGDGISSIFTFGLNSTADVRQSLGIVGGVDQSSSAYNGGQYAGYVWGTATMWAAGFNGGQNSVFWAGRGASTVADTLGTTISKTPIGAVLNGLGVENRFVWGLASSTFAANASGTADAVIRHVSPESLWLIERSILIWRGIPIMYH
jgi:RHS repeat-associated protein